jgi:hypothetical protein
MKRGLDLLRDKTLNRSLAVARKERERLGSNPNGVSELCKTP